MLTHNFQQLGSFLILVFVNSKKYSEFQQNTHEYETKWTSSTFSPSFCLDSVSLLCCGGSRVAIRAEFLTLK